ncbi:MAG: histidine kinase [Acidobacteria bacterium]|nr:histidine kinase [Acidobacteriota bacterium]
MLQHKMTDAYFIGQTLGFSAGVVMSALLLDLLRRAAAKQPGARAKYWQVAFALMWNLGGLLGQLGNMAGALLSSPWMLAVMTLNFSGAAFFPVGFLMLWQRPRDENTWRALACRWLCRATMVSAGVLTLLFLKHCAGLALMPEAGNAGHWQGNLLAYHVAAATLAGTFLLWRGRLNNFAARFYAATTLLGVLTPAALTLLASVFGWHEQQPDNWVIIAEQQAPLLILLGAVVYFGDFRFSNVYVKWCLRFLAALLLALIFCLVVIYVLPPLARRLTPFTLAGSVLGGAAFLTALLCGFAWLAPKLNRLVDNWLFREPDYALATQQIWRELSQQEDIETIFALSARLAEETLGLQEARIVPLHALPAEHLAAALNSGEVCELKPVDPLRGRIGAEVEFLAPIRLSGQPTHVLAITPGAQRRNLLDSELHFLRGLAGQVSGRLEVLSAERERVELQNKEERLRRQLTEAELRALRTQINPHFLFNSLNTIADLIVAEPATAERMTVQLAKIFRHVLRTSDRQMVSVGEELEFLKTWLDIEAVRFGERLRVRFETDAALTAENVPPLILQPLVENALKHGLAPKLGGGVLQVRVALCGEQLSLTVEDDGLGFPAALAANVNNGEARQPATNGIGLRNVAERLATIYAGRAQMRFEAVATGGSRVTLLLPRTRSEA